MLTSHTRAWSAELVRARPFRIPRATRELFLLVGLASGLAGILVGAALGWALPGIVLAGLLATGAGAAGAVVLRQWLGAFRPLPSHPVAGGRLVIILPARNERAAIGDVIRGIPHDDLIAAGWRPLVLVVDDGSTDETDAVARAAGADMILRHARSRGLGAALRTGLEGARELDARAAVYLDADGEYDPAHLPRLLAPIIAGEADYVLGSRFRGRREGMCWQRRFGNRGFTWLTSVLCGRHLTDAQTGYRAFSRRALDRAAIIHDYNYAQVLTLRLLRRRMALSEVPIDYRVRQSGRSFIRGFEYCRRVLPAIARELVAD